jgi:hypothetical protein
MVAAILALQKAGLSAEQAKAITEVFVTKTELETAVAPLQKTMRAIADDVVTLLLSVFHMDKANVDIGSHPNN